MDVTVICGTFGPERWIRLARKRARPSALEQGVPFIHEHANTLAQARNKALAQVETEFVLCCDADDLLEPGYIDAMAKGTADVRCPSVRMVFPTRTNPTGIPRVASHEHACTAECLRYGNWVLIASVVRTEIAKQVGWEEWIWSEDWAFWARCWVAGATFEVIPEAVYQKYWYGNSRNRMPGGRAYREHRKMEKAIWPDEPPAVFESHPAFKPGAPVLRPAGVP